MKVQPRRILQWRTRVTLHLTKPVSSGGGGNFLALRHALSAIRALHAQPPTSSLMVQYSS